MKRPEEMTMDEAYAYCLKLERDRERSWRGTRQGAFESSFMSIDEHVAKFDDPSKIVAFSDGGVGAAEIWRTAGREAEIAHALDRLTPADRDFVRTVLSGKGWRETGLGKRSFNKRLAAVCRRVGE